jgi:hypothetical protein
VKLHRCVGIGKKHSEYRVLYCHQFQVLKCIPWVRGDYCMMYLRNFEEASNSEVCMSEHLVDK